MKKVGYFFASFLPLMITYALQFFAMFFMLGVAALFLFPAFPQAQTGLEGFQKLYRLMTDSNFNGMVMIIYSILCTVLFGMWYYRNCGGDYLPEPKKTFHILQFVGIIVLIPGTQFLCSYLISFLSLIFPSWLEQYERIMEYAGFDESMSVILLCYSILLAPINEELIFRGVTMRLAKQALPFWGANLLQAFLFGVLHGNWLQGCYAAALGLLLGFICEKGGSIYYSILMHMLFNFWGTVVSNLLSGVDDLIATAVVMLITTIVSLSVGLALFLVGIKRKKERISRLEQAAVQQPSFISVQDIPEQSGQGHFNSSSPQD